MPHIIKRGVSAICAAFMMAATAYCASSILKEHKHNTQSMEASLSAPTQSFGPRKTSLGSTDNAQDIIRYTMFNLEGSGYVPNDNGHGPSRYGILGEANGLSDDEVKNLTPEKAIELYKRNYWDALQIGDLPPNMRMVAFNNATQFGPQRARVMITEAQNDPYKLLNENDDLYDKIVAKNPERYGGSVKSWKARQSKLMAYLNNKQSEFATRVASRTPSPRGWISNISYKLQNWMTPHKGSSDEPISSPAQASTQDTPKSLHVTEANLRGLLPASIPLNLLKWFSVLFGMLVLDPLFSFFKRDSKQKDDTPLPKVKKLNLAEIQPLNLPIANNVPAEALRGYWPYLNLTDAESAAFYRIFWRHSPTQVDNQWRVIYREDSHVHVRQGNVNIFGECGIEDSLLYASQAWGNKCKMTGGSDLLRQQISEAAQRLVDEGLIPSGFVIEGVGQFEAPVRRQNKPRFAQSSGHLQMA